MTHEEARRLIGEYAAGSLTAEETERLFHAALEDQDLFDELAGEHALKELLDEPGAKHRLIAALGAGKRAPVAWWKRRLVWSAAALAAVGIAVTTWSILHAPKPVQVAQVSAPAVTPPAVEEPHPAPARTPRPSPKRVRAKPAAPPPAAKEEAASSSGSATPSPAAGFVPNAAPLSAPMRAAAAPIRGIAFDYTIDGAMLNLRFLSTGFLSIQFLPGGDAASNESVAAGTLRHQPIPDGATQAHIVFTAKPDTSSGGVSLERDPPSGRAADPGGTRIDLTLRLP